MTTTAKREIAGYFIQMPQEHIPDLMAFCEERGVTFDPVNNLTAYHRELFLDSIWTGEYGPDVIKDINDHQNTPAELRITKPFTDMTPAQQWSVLLYATLHCEWRVDYDERILESTNPAQLEKLREEYPQLFA